MIIINEIVENVFVTVEDVTDNITIQVNETVAPVTIEVSEIGLQGLKGEGVPNGGTTGQVLAKKTDTNYDTEWVTNSGGGGGISDAPNNANAYVRSGLAWVIGYTKTAIDALISGFQTAGQVQTIADAKVSDTAYDETSWNGVTTIAPSKNAVRDKIQSTGLEQILAINNNATIGIVIEAEGGNTGVYGGSIDGKGVWGYSEEGLAGEFGTNGTGNIVDFKSSGVLKTAIQNDGKITATAGTASTDVVVKSQLDDKVSDTAYDVTSWNGVTTIAPSKNAVRDKIDNLEATLSQKQRLATYNDTQATIAILTDIGDLQSIDTSVYPTLSELINVKGVTSPIQTQLGNKQPLATVLTNTTASFTTADETKLDKYPSTATNGKILQGNGTNYVEVDSPGSPTTIVGITGTKAQYDTSVTDGNFMYVGDAPTSHTHTASEVTDFNSASRAQTEAELVAGTNITITPSGTGATRQLTIASSGGGGGVAPQTGQIIVTSGTSFTTPADITITTVFNIELVGGGGGGAGTAGTSGSTGSGGGGGGYCFVRLTGLSPSTSYTCSIGSGGSGGAASSNGGVGGTTSLIIGGDTYEANNGLGGITGATQVGGAGGGASGGDINISGQSGGGSGGTSAAVTSSRGGDSHKGWGSGGAEVSSGTVGKIGTGYGSGGSGGRGTSVAGGAGKSGIIYAQWFNQ